MQSRNVHQLVCTPLGVHVLVWGYNGLSYLKICVIRYIVKAMMTV